MRPLSFPSSQPLRRGSARLWVRRHDPGDDSRELAAHLLGEAVARNTAGRLVRARGDLSVSHAGGWWVMAAVERGRVGIDIETLRERPNALQIARAQFPRGEAEALARLAPQRRSEAFLRLWCAREAVLKAHGAGMEAGFDVVEFELTPRATRCATWKLREFRLRGHVGVLACSD